MNHETVDILYRSRITLLDHLQEFGYDTTPFRKFSHKEINEMLKAGPPNAITPALQMELNRIEEATDDMPSKCLVAYTTGKIKQKLIPTIEKFTGPLKKDDEKVSDEEKTDFDKTTTELIIVTLEPIAPNFHTAAATVWIEHKVRVRFFQAASIVNNPLKHILVPKHEKMSKEDAETFLKENYAKRTQLPLIRFHEDPIARMIGLIPGDIVKITRPSVTAGECIMYRVCVP
jgi:DNA-directed RNA polymerase subunit H